MKYAIYSFKKQSYSKLFNSAFVACVVGKIVSRVHHDERAVVNMATGEVYTVIRNGAYDCRMFKWGC